jgi:hypothetical protein
VLSPLTWGFGAVLGDRIAEATVNENLARRTLRRFWPGLSARPSSTKENPR